MAQFVSLKFFFFTIDFVQLAEVFICLSFISFSEGITYWTSICQRKYTGFSISNFSCLKTGYFD